MKKTMKTLAACLAVAAIVVTGCKKGDTGPAGANGANGLVATSTDGFIKGNISGYRQGNTIPFNIAFNFQNYWSSHSATLDSIGFGTYLFSLQRANSLTSNDGCRMSITTTPSATVSTGSITLSTFAVSQSLGGNKEFDFSVTNNPTAAATQLSYNPSTGLFTGNISATIPANQNSTGQIATLNGSFQCTVTQLYMMVKHTSPHQIVKD
jgi:hypothetical protein